GSRGSRRDGIFRHKIRHGNPKFRHLVFRTFRIVGSQRCPHPSDGLTSGLAAVPPRPPCWRAGRTRLGSAGAPCPVYLISCVSPRSTSSSVPALSGTVSPRTTAFARAGDDAGGRPVKARSVAAEPRWGRRKARGLLPARDVALGLLG